MDGEKKEKRKKNKQRKKKKKTQKRKKRKNPTTNQTKTLHKNPHQISQTSHRIFPVLLPKHFVKMPSLLHYVLKLLGTIALQSQPTKNNQPTCQ